MMDPAIRHYRVCDHCGEQFCLHAPAYHRHCPECPDCHGTGLIATVVEPLTSAEEGAKCFQGEINRPDRTDGAGHIDAATGPR